MPDYLSKGRNLPSLTASYSVISNVDDMNGADSQAANTGNVKKSTIALIAHILSELPPYQCWLIYCIYVLYFHYREDETILDGSIPRVADYKNVKVLKKFCLGFHNLAEKILS